MSTDTQFKKVLDTMAKFHHYSANNVLLIAMQMPAATHVASYTNWQKKFHRQVKRGQHGLSIIAPAPYKKKTEREVQDPRTGKPVLGSDGTPKMEEVEITVPRYKVTKVFDLSQTFGAPLPELDVPELTGTAENYEIFMDAMRAVSPVPIRFDSIEGGAKGYYDSRSKEIVIQEGMSELQTMKTAVHEVSHARLHDRDVMQAEGTTKDQRTKELEAESIAYVVLSHYQMDTSDYSIPYLASWSGSQDTAALRASMDTIRKAASEIFDEVEAYIEQRDVDRYTIYQIGEDTPARDYSFMDLDHVKEQGHTVSIAYYQDVYRGYLRPDDSLESLYTRFNMDDRPAADRMHSLSVSDVVVLHKSGEDRAYYVDSVGFKEIPEFFLSPPEQEPAGRDVSEKTELPDQVASEQGSERAAPEKSKTEDQASHNAEEEPTEIDGQEKALSFYAAENMDFPVMGQYRDGLTLALAAEVYQNLPPGRMKGGKGIGCTIHDENGDPINIRLVTDGRIQEDSLKGLEQHREYPALKAALQEAKTYFPDQSFPTKHVEQRTAAVPVPGSRKESVLAALREHQKNIGKPGPDHKERNLTPQQRKKGELSL